MTVALFIVSFLVLVLAGAGKLHLPLSYSNNSGATDEGARLVNVKFLVQRDLAYSAVSSAQIYVWESGFQGDAKEILSTDSSGLATSQQTYWTGTTLYVVVKASGYYPYIGTVKIPNKGLASEQTVVTLPAIKLKYISTTVSLGGSTVGSTAITASGSASVSTAFSMDLKISGLAANSYYGCGDYIDYTTSAKYEYVGPIFIVKLNASLIAPESSYGGDVFFDGTYYYYIFKGTPVVNDANDPYDGQGILSIQWNVLSSGVVSLSVYVLDSVKANSLGIPQSLISDADASILNFALTVS